MFEVVYGSHLHEPPTVVEEFTTEKEAETYVEDLTRRSFFYESVNYWVRKKS